MNRKIISLFLTAVIGAITGFCLFSATPEKRTISPEERQLIIAEQKLFSDWYEDYKHNLEQLDFCWQQYHRILGDLRREEINSDAAWVRLKQLKNKQAYVVAEIKRLTPPEKLRPPLSDNTSAIYKKTLAYAESQAKAIKRSFAALDDETASEAALSRKADECCIAEAPAALFTAADIAAVRSYLQIDEN